MNTAQLHISTIGIALLYIAILCGICNCAFSIPIEEDEADEFDIMTCSSAFRLIHSNTKYYLHSGALMWGSGSKQQAVTATDTDDNSTVWNVMEGYNNKSCVIGEPMYCDSYVQYVSFYMCICSFTLSLSLYIYIYLFISIEFDTQKQIAI